MAGVRRFLLRRSRYHVYYEYDVAADLVRVVSVWGAVRGQGPDLRLLLRR